MNAWGILFGLLGLMTGMVLSRLRVVDRRIDRLARIEAKLDALLGAGGIAFDPNTGVPADVAEALDRGETIQAIRQFRLATGAGLREAKEQIDALRRLRSAER